MLELNLNLGLNLGHNLIDRAKQIIKRKIKL
jgi:hypothetical protein